MVASLGRMGLGDVLKARCKYGDVITRRSVVFFGRAAESGVDALVSADGGGGAGELLWRMVGLVWRRLLRLVGW
jgi:hypothetical protein